MTTNSQLSTTEPNKTKTKTKQTTRTGTEPEKQRSHGGLSAGSGRERMGEKVEGRRSINGKYKIDGEVKNSMGNGEAKEIIYMTHEPRWGNDGGGGYKVEGNKEEKFGIVIA